MESGVYAMRPPRLLVATLLSIALCAHASASPFTLPRSPEARRQLEVGNRLLELRNYTLAIEAYKRGYLLGSDAVFLHNLALAHRLAGDYKAAISYYQSFLRRGKPRADVRAAIEKLIGQMQDELVQAARTRPPVEPEPRTATPRSASQATKAGKLAAVTTPAPSPPRWYRDRVAWALAAAGLVAGGASAGLFANASSLRDERDRTPGGSARDALDHKAGRRQSWAIVTGLTSVALLGGAVVKLALGGAPARAERGESRAGVAFAIGPGALGLRGRF